MSPHELREEEDLKAVSPSILVRLGGGGLMLCGLLTALLGLQLLLSVRATGLIAVAPYVWLAVGVGAIAVGWQVNRARDWAAFAGIAVGATLAVAHLIWMFVSFSSGIYSLLALLNLPLAFGAVLGTLVALPSCRRATEARQRLRAIGLDVGI